MALNSNEPAHLDKFTQLVKQVLENFYDFPYLNRHLLAKITQQPYLRPSETDGQRLRRIFLAAIDSLKPGGAVEERSIFGRYYHLLQLRYVDSNTMQEVARILGVSERQAYRDLKRAEENLANELWTHYGEWPSICMDVPAVSDGESATSADSAYAAGEINELNLKMTSVPMLELLKNALKAVDRLAAERSIELEVTTTGDPSENMLSADPEMMIYTDPGFAQQMLISIISSIIQNTSAGRVRIHCERTENRLRLLFALDQPLHQSYTLPGEPVIHVLLERLAWQVTQNRPSGSGAWTLAVEIPLQETVLLVIDDNNALIELLRRYLTQTRCQVVGVNSGLEGLQLAQSLKPEAILLDIMMPNIDGWEILQRLRANPETSSIPVIVCSIFNDPGLARSLGAAHTLAKPVNRTDMLNLFSELSLV